MQFGTTKSGNQSAKVAGKTVKGWRTYLRLQRIAEMEANLYSDTEIAFMLNVTPQYVNMLKRHPDYVAARVTAGMNSLSEGAKQSLRDLEDRREMMEDMVPDALLAIKDALQGKMGPTLRLKASQDLLDREGSLAKISRTEVSIPKNFNYDEHDKKANDLLSVLTANDIKRQEEQQTKENSTLGVDEFTSTSLSREAQKQMQEAMDLINSIKLNPSELVN